MDGILLEDQNVRIPIGDRCWQYGDGLFETLRISEGTPVFWEDHIERLKHSSSFLGIPLPVQDEMLLSQALDLIQRNQIREGVLKIQLSRGSAPRGLSISSDSRPSLLLTTHSVPEPNTSCTKLQRLRRAPHPVYSQDPLLQHKTCNKLSYILAKREADLHEFDDAVLVNERDEITETTSANLCFINSRDQLQTAPPDCGLLPGITRKKIMDLWRTRFGPESISETAVHWTDLGNTQAAFLTVSTRGLVPLCTIHHHHYGSPLHPKLQILLQDYTELIRHSLQTSGRAD